MGKITPRSRGVLRAPHPAVPHRPPTPFPGQRRSPVHCSDGGHGNCHRDGDGVRHRPLGRGRPTGRRLTGQRSGPEPCHPGLVRARCDRRHSTVGQGGRARRRRPVEPRSRPGQCRGTAPFRLFHPRPARGCRGVHRRGLPAHRGCTSGRVAGAGLGARHRRARRRVHPVGAEPQPPRHRIPQPLARSGLRGRRLGLRRSRNARTDELPQWVSDRRERHRLRRRGEQAGLGGDGPVDAVGGHRPVPGRRGRPARRP